MAYPFEAVAHRLKVVGDAAILSFLDDNDEQLDVAIDTDFLLIMCEDIRDSVGPILSLGDLGEALHPAAEFQYLTAAVDPGPMGGKNVDLRLKINGKICTLPLHLPPSAVNNLIANLSA